MTRAQIILGALLIPAGSYALVYHLRDALRLVLGAAETIRMAAL